jgi:hydrogenase expression/formation protein HypE
VTFDPKCPVPLASEVIQLAHGGGGRTSWKLLHDVVLPALGASPGDASLDAAVLSLPAEGGRLAFTTDASIVRPLFFPGGDIGTLAVYGSVNDLAAVGARPLALSLSLVIEEGLPLDTLRRVLGSIARASERAGVRVVTGDTKVVDRGRGDGIYTSVAGVGIVPAGVDLSPKRIRPGDAIVVTGDVGRHGVAILSVREGLAFESPVESDCAPVTPLVEALLGAGVELHALRDPTRGGLAAALNELCLDAGVAMTVREQDVPVSEPVRAACELLGLDPFAMACEGRLVVFVASAHAERAVAVLHAHPLGASAAVIGGVEDSPAGRVTLTTRLGTRRALDFLTGEALPRIC